MTKCLFSLFFGNFNHLFFSAYISFICNILHALCFFHFIRFIEKKIPQEISIKFYQNITRPWTTFSKYPKEQPNMIYELYKEALFETDDLVLEREVFDKHVKRCYSDWMWHLREKCVKNKIPRDEWYKHPPDDVTPTIWKEMCNKWNDRKWKVIIKWTLLIVFF